VLVIGFIEQHGGSGIESMFERVHGGCFAAFFGDGSVGFRAIGTGGIDFALCRHECSLSTLLWGLGWREQGVGLWMVLEMGKIEVSELRDPTN
jgi:hypothetical protein